MSTWRSSELEEIFGGPLDDTYLTEIVLQGLVAASAREMEQLDFKACPTGTLPYPKTVGARSGWLKEQEFVKDVLAFANHRGGALVIGVDADSNDVAVATTPMTSSDAATEEQRLRAALLNYSAPFVDCTFVPIQGASGWYLLVLIPPSSRSPHCVLSDKGDARTALRYPVRHGADTSWLSESEVAERYRRRSDAISDERARVTRVIDGGRQALHLAEGLWLYVATIPEMATGSTMLDNQQLEMIDAWHHSGVLYSPLGERVDALGRGIAAPGRVAFVQSLSETDDESVPRDGLVELYLDGSAFAAALLSESAADGDTCLLIDSWVIDSLIVLVDEALRWTAHRAGAWSTATVAVGIEDANQQFVTGHTRPLILGTHGPGGRARKLGRTRVVTEQAPRAETVADLAAVNTLQQRLAVVRNAADRLLQCFGVAEADRITPIGAIDAPKWQQGYQTVKTWAHNHGVELVLSPGDTL